MVNKEKYLISWWRTDIGRSELAKVEESILNCWISQGPVTEKLEKRLGELLNVPYVALTANGSMALLMALIACGIKPGDEVIVPNRTFIATANAPLLLGAKVRLVDVECSRPVIDPKKVERAITSKTRVIIPVHLNGRAVDIEGISKLAAKYGIGVIEDASEALCSRNHLGALGTQSDMGVFSLSMTKLITTGQGGFIVTKNKNTFKKLKEIRNQGVSSGFPRRHERFGFNFKFNDILAGIGLSQIEKVKKNIASLKSVYNFYDRELRNSGYIRMIEVDLEKGEIPLWAEAICAERDRVIALLKKRGIQAVPLSPSLCEMPHLKTRNNFNYSKIYSKYGLILPCGPDQTLRDLKLTVNALEKIKGKIKTKVEVIGGPVS